MSRQDPTRVLQKLRAQGVAKARFHENGRLASVEFWPGSGEASHEVQDDGGDAEGGAVRATARTALRMLKGELSADDFEKVMG